MFQDMLQRDIVAQRRHYPWQSLNSAFAPGCWKTIIIGSIAKPNGSLRTIGKQGDLCLACPPPWSSSVQQALQAGLLDEFHMAVAHVLLGEGVRLFDHLGASPIHLEHLRSLETLGATHLSFRVVN